MKQEVKTRPTQLVKEAIEGAVSKLADGLANRWAFDLSWIHLECDELTEDGALVVLGVEGSRFQFHDLTKDKETTVEIIDGEVRVNPWQGEYSSKDQCGRDLTEVAELINKVVTDLIERNDFTPKANDRRTAD